MKRLLSLMLAMLLALGMLFACGKPTAETGSGSKNGEASAQYAEYELISQVTIMDIDGGELFLDFNWAENGATADGYYLIDGEKEVIKVDILLDEQKRPSSIIRKKTSATEETERSIQFSYLSESKVKVTQTYNGGNESSCVYEYDETGRRVAYEYGDYKRSYEYDSYGNCVREHYLNITDGSEEEIKTEYIYDSEGRLVFATEKTTPDGGETQFIYSNYPNGNVMFFTRINDEGNANYCFRPYNVFDLFSWSYGMSVSAYGYTTAEKNADGYITKVTRSIGGKTSEVTFEYNADGKLIASQDTGEYGSKLTIEYDAQNRPVRKIEDSSDKKHGSLSETVYSYDELGRLINEKYTSTDGSSHEKTRSYTESGMTKRYEKKREDTYSGELKTSVEAMEFEYIKDAPFKLDIRWVALFMSSLLSGVMRGG